jgi:hypothetical protein
LGFGTGTVTTVVSSTAGPIASAVRFDYDNTERVYFDQAITVTSGTQYAFSIYVEALSGAVAGDVLTVTNGTTSGTVNTFVTSPSVTGRYTLLFTANGNGTVNLRAGAGTTAALGGTGSITLSRPQCEAGSFATSYIPTTVAQVTRERDVASVNTLSPWYNATEGTLYVQALRGGDVDATIATFSIGSTTADRIQIHSATSSEYRATYRTGNVEQAALLLSSSTNSPKIAATIKTNDLAASINGASPQTDTTASIAAYDTLWIGRRSDADVYWNGHVQRITYYPRSFSGAELQTLTA